MWFVYKELGVVVYDRCRVLRGVGWIRISGVFSISPGIDDVGILQIFKRHGANKSVFIGKQVCDIFLHSKLALVTPHTRNVALCEQRICRKN
jgi:hypothetical protein